MSSPFKAIGKVFKSVIRVVKKVALPALAIGAVLLTGGAALGVLPSVGSLAGSLGLSNSLAAVLSTAAKSAAFGAVGSALTGGNIVKGASMGFLAGGALGGLGALTAKAGGTAANLAGSAGSDILKSAAQPATAAQAPTAALPPVADGASFTEAFEPLSRGGLGGSMAASAPVVASAPMVASSAPPVASGGMFGGAFDFISPNPMVQGMMIQGLGGGMQAREASKQQRREREAIGANYTTDGLYRLSDSGGLGVNLPDAAEAYSTAMYNGRVAYDPKTGRIVPVRA